MKLDPSVPYLGSLLALVLCATAVGIAWALGGLATLLHAWAFYAVAGGSLLTLLASHHALGRPLDADAPIAAPAPMPVAPAVVVDTAMPSLTA